MVNSYTPSFLNEQAQHTAPTRRFLYSQVRWDEAPISLDLGCGACTITPELTTLAPHATALGIDRDPSLLASGVQHCTRHPSIHLLLADITALPLRSSCLTFALSHFTLMWVRKRARALAEIYRALRPKGALASIEPDYSGRIEYPPPSRTRRPSTLPIIRFLERSGADPYLGGRLPYELAQAGFQNIRFGVLAWNYNPAISDREIRTEAKLLQASNIQWTPPSYTFTPIFWALAYKPKKPVAKIRSPFKA